MHYVLQEIVSLKKGRFFEKIFWTQNITKNGFFNKDIQQGCFEIWHKRKVINFRITN